MYHKAALSSPTVCSRPGFETCGHHRAPASCKLAAGRNEHHGVANAGIDIADGPGVDLK